MNPLDDALKNAVKQNLWNTDKDGIFVVYNPPTTNPISELIYAAYDKNNDLLGGRLPLTNAEKTNIELYRNAKDSGYLLDISNHSRGGLTASVAIQNANRNGLTKVPLNKVRFYGTATNVQDYSNWLIENNKFINPETGNSTGVYSAVHQADFVGRPPLILGGNPSTGGNCWLCYSHSSYSSEIPSEYLVNNNGQFIDKNGVVIPKEKSVKNEYYEEYSKKWGDSNSHNLSLPLLVPSNKSKEVIKYEKDPF
jgi:filamentous hemagglutinin